MQAFVTSKNVKWCHLIWPTLYIEVTTLTFLGRVTSSIT